MKTTQFSVLDLAERRQRMQRGLHSLMGTDGSTLSFDQCHEYVRPSDTHPFGLSLPIPSPGHWRGKEIKFVGGHATDTTVQVLLAQIRFWTNHCEEGQINKLRIINTPFGAQVDGRNYVFFEAWVGAQVIISGETTNFSGGGKSAREELLNVFVLLSEIYGVPIEEVQLTEHFELRKLYQIEIGARV